MSQEKSTSKWNLVVRFISVSVVAVLPFVGAVLFYLFLPGFIVPFLNNTIARIVLLALMFWECIGLFLLFRAKDWKSWWLFSIIFTQPISTVLTIGPYIVTFVNLVGPCLDIKPSAIGTTPPPGAAEWGNMVLSVVTLYWNHSPIQLHLISIILLIVGIIVSYPGIWLRFLRLTKSENG